LQKTDILLPRHLIPEYYKLQLIPFLIPDNYTVGGYVEIVVKCEVAGKNVTLHAANITLDQSAISITEKESNIELEISEHVQDVERQFYVAKLNDHLKPGKHYVIKIKFVSIMSEANRGTFLNLYKDDAGNSRYETVIHTVLLQAKYKCHYTVFAGQRAPLSSSQPTPAGPFRASTSRH
jgi:hypothetical protein